MVLVLLGRSIACGGDDDAPPVDGVSSGADLDATLLTVDALGDDWVESEVGVGTEVFERAPYKPWCERGSRLEMPAPVDEVQVAFDDPSGRVVASATGEFASGDAEEWTATNFEELERCEDEAGAEGTFEVDRLDDLGDEAIEVKVSFRAYEGRQTYGVAIVRVDDRVGYIETFAETGDGLDEDDLLRVIARRL